MGYYFGRTERAIRRLFASEMVSSSNQTEIDQFSYFNHIL